MGPYYRELFSRVLDSIAPWRKSPLLWLVSVVAYPVSVGVLFWWKGLEATLNEVATSLVFGFVGPVIVLTVLGLYLLLKARRTSIKFGKMKLKCSPES
jgi:hypothetical protein